MNLFTATPKDGAAWVTGASAGIGLEVALRLAEEGFTVYASARSADKLNAIADGFKGQGKIIPLPLDVTDRAAAEASVDQIVEQSGAIAISILNAGTFRPQSAKNFKFEDFDFTMDVNVNGVVNCLVPSIGAMQEKGQGQIAIVSSVAGYGGLPKNGAYGLSKAGITNLTESLKFDLDKMNIKIQLVSPGFIDTPLTQKNDFPMPFLMPADKASKRIVDGLKTQKFELTFPRRFTFMLKAINLLAYPIYFWTVKKMTGG